MSEEDYDLPRLTKIYRKIRDAREQHTAEYNKRDAEFKEQLQQVAHLMMAQMGQNTSVANEHGSIRKVLKTKYWSTDWDSFRKFVVEENAVELIENRVQQSNMAAWLAKNPTKIPPGLQVDSRYDVVVSKPRSKPEME